MLDNEEYSVGYKKPPKKSQFKSGKSGNPKGRPKKSKNLETLFKNELQEKIIINENGRRTTVTKREAFVKTLVNDSLLMKTNSVRSVLTIIQAIDEKEAAKVQNSNKDKISEEDKKILERFMGEKISEEINDE